MIDHKIGLNERNIKDIGAIDVVVKQMAAINADLIEGRIDANTAQTRKQQNTTLLEQLLKAGTNPDLRARDGLTQIFRAVALIDDPKVIDKLLLYSKNPGQKCNGDTLLDHAVKMKKQNIVGHLAKKADTVQLVQAIALAHKQAIPEIKELLLNQLQKKDKKIYQQLSDKMYEFIANPNYIDSNGVSNFSKLIKSGNIIAVEAAINLGADVNLRSKAGSPLQMALFVPVVSSQLSKMLIQAGAGTEATLPHVKREARSMVQDRLEPHNVSGKASKVLLDRISQKTTDQYR